MIKSFLILTAVAGTLACQLGCAPAQPPAAPDTRAADEQAIREGEAQWVRDFATKDVEKVAAHYADDASSMIPLMTLMTGKDAIRAGLKQEFSDPHSALALDPANDDVSTSSDL